MNINEQVVHDLLTRQIDLMRYERGVRREVLRQLERMHREIEAKLRQHDLDTLSKREWRRCWLRFRKSCTAITTQLQAA